MRTLALMSMFTVALASADTITMKNGRVLNGTYLGGTAREVRLDTGDRVETVPVERISTLQFDSSSSAPAPQSDRRQPSGYDSPRNDAPRNDAPRYDTARNDSQVNRSGYVIPQGTPITVRMIDSVDSESARLGDRFRASIEDPIVINGDTIVPRGADVTARLVDDKQSGKISGRTELTLALVQITVNGRTVDVTTSDVVEASSSRGARSGKVIGGTTALGAIIGAVAGGGRGAAIGAASGAAVGTGAEVATKGQRVKIPSEARLTFTLSNDVRI